MSLDIDRYLGHGRFIRPVGGPIGEGIDADKIGVRRVGKRPIGIEDQGPVARGTVDGGRDRIVFRVRVVSQDSLGRIDCQNAVLVDVEEVVGDDRSIIELLDVDRHRDHVGIERPVVSLVSEGIRAEEVCNWRVNERAVDVQGQRAVLGQVDQQSDKRIRIVVQIIGQDAPIGIDQQGVVFRDRVSIVDRDGRVIYRLDGDRHLGLVRVVEAVGCNVGENVRAEEIRIGRVIERTIRGQINRPMGRRRYQRGR